MIGRIQGQLVEVAENVILVNTGGICYEVELTSTALGRLPAAEAPVDLFTHFLVREDAQLLYGFASRDERDLFRALIRITGVGPKLALNLISSVPLADLARSVQNNDVALLTRVPGVGRKTAERLLVELKDRLADLVVVAEVGAPPSGGKSAVEAEEALIALGYKPLEAQRVVSEVLEEGVVSTEEIVRAALKHIAMRREVNG
ncbi:MAG: Holliday junction branch migration protein RuvA [Pseudomonadales bacterium]|nr:Holliday junction branch migration protein RuvA [Pseudomonadales bacterium]NIX09883.1 Holliday junction branch migration protein RuvA [Pseudomonadales bacterium]